MMNELNPKRRSDGVYEWLRRAIVTGEIRPNEPLIEADLAAKLEVSRTPVRESLQRLASVGLILPRKRGWSVREYTPQEIRENSEVRIALEGYATALAAERASEAELAGIRDLHQSRLGLKTADEALRVKTNREFHDAIIAAAQNPRLTNAIYASGQFYFNAPIARLTIQEELSLGNAEHERIVQHLLARDAVGAESAMRDHIRRTFSVFQRVTELKSE